MRPTRAVYAKSGYHATIKKYIELQLQLAKRRYGDPVDIASNYADLGDRDQAFACWRRLTWKNPIISITSKRCINWMVCTLTPAMPRS